MNVWRGTAPAVLFLRYASNIATVRVRMAGAASGSPTEFEKIQAILSYGRALHVRFSRR